MADQTIKRLPKKLRKNQEDEVTVSVSLAKSLVTRLDACAEDDERSRAVMLRRLLEAGIRGYEHENGLTEEVDINEDNSSDTYSIPYPTNPALVDFLEKAR